MASPVSEAMARRIEAALPLESGITPRNLFHSMGGDFSSPSGIRTVLLHLVRTGRATRDGEIGNYRYRRTMECAQ